MYLRPTLTIDKRLVCSVLSIQEPSHRATRMSTSKQTTLDDLPRTKPFKTSQQPKSKTTEPIEEVDYSTTDFTACLQEDIKAARKRKGPPLEGSVHVKQEETEKFLKKAKISFLGQNVKARTRSPSRVHIASQKLSVFKNNTGKEVNYTFRKTAQDTTTAQLTTSTGFKIGVLAFLGGGGMGPQGGMGVGAEYSRGTESTKQSSNACGREMQVQVSIPINGSAKVFETDYSTAYDAECDFDIAIEDSHQIEYFEDSGESSKIKAGDLKSDNDTVTTTKSWVKKLVTKHIPPRIVHLRRSCKCKLVSIEHDLEMELDPDSKSKGVSEASETDKTSEDEGDDTPDTGGVHK